MSDAVTLEILSGAPGTRGNAYLLRRGETSILLDCGEGDDAWLDHLDPPSLTVVTHAHLDHAGAMGRFRERFPTAPVFASAETRASMKASLASRVGLERATAISDTTTSVRFHENFRCGDLELRLLPAGHCPGAAMVEVSWGERRFVYTGDISVRALTRAGSAEPPDAPDWLLVEGVLSGARALDAFDPGEVRHDLQAWLGHGGPRLLAVEGVGEGPEIAALLDDLSGASFFVHENLVDFGVDGPVVSDARAYDTLKNGAIVLVSGAELLPKTAARILAEKVMGEPSARIGFFNGVGAQTFAQTLLRTPRRARVRDAGDTRLKARVKRFDWPLHPTRSELERWIEGARAKQVFLTHGQESALHGLKRRLMAAGVRVEVVGTGAFTLEELEESD